MKNKTLIIVFSAFTLAFTGAVNAANSADGSQNQAGQQTQTANQGENIQIQVQQQTQTQEQLRDESGADSQAQTQNQVRNEGETNQAQSQEREAVQMKGADGPQMAEQRRSMVANAVQEMLQVAERNGGIGQQVKTIAQAQVQNQEKLEASLQKIQSRSGFAKFFVGPNYDEINNAKKILEQNREQIEQLNQTKNQLANQDDEQNLTRQIQTLEQASLEIKNSLETAQKGFSLLGWMFRLFSK
ncbi:MAG: hypothetical protein PHQ42_01255 [Patescibacteria group bacterium]|nr:hypothetical protein [Patescibacteria group bacterium]